MVDYDRLAAAYAKHRTVHPGVVREIVDRASLSSASKVLEVGCGTANYLRALAEQTGCEAYGIDPSAGMLSRAAEGSPALHLQPGRAEALGFPSGSFDLVYSVDVIHHVTDRAGFLREAFRVIAPGGRVLTVTDSEWIIRHREPLAVYFPASVAPEIRRYPRLNDLRAWMREAGFCRLSEKRVEHSYFVTNLEPYRTRVYSSLRLISEHDFQRGLQKMERDLSRGPLPARSRYLLLWGSKPHSVPSGS